MTTISIDIKDYYLKTHLQALLNIITPLNGWICGGLPAYLYLTGVYHRSINSNIGFHDIDIFCQDQEAYDKITKEINLKMIPYLVQDKEWCLELSTSYKLQIIKPKQTRTLQEHLETFDLSCSQFALTAIDELTLLKPTDKYIKVENIHNPHYTFYRLFKYAQRGWQIQSPELIKVFIAYKNSSDNYKKELEVDLLNYEVAPLKARFERMMDGYSF